MEEIAEKKYQKLEKDEVQAILDELMPDINRLVSKTVKEHLKAIAVHTIDTLTED